MKKNSRPAEGTEEAFYQLCLSLSTATLRLVGDLLRGHLKQIRSRWRKLPPGKSAAIVLAVLRYDQRLCDMAAANRPPVYSRP